MTVWYPEATGRGAIGVMSRRGTVMTRQERIGIVGVVFAAAAVVVAVLAYFGERAERRNEQRFKRVEAAIEVFARDSQRRDDRIEATLETVARDLGNLAVDVAFLARRQAERDAADAGN